MDNTRFYSFVAGLYLSPLQCGLQTAHAVSEVYDFHSLNRKSKYMLIYNQWASTDKTIIILNALNSRGVLNAHVVLLEFAKQFLLPLAIFHEDADSLNGAATACGMVIPRKFYDVTFTKGEEAGESYFEHISTFKEDGTALIIESYHEDSNHYNFCAFLKTFRLV